MLGETIKQFLPDLRAAAESMQTDACSIDRAGTGEGAFDQETGTTTPPPRLAVYAGLCRIRVPTASERETTAGEHTWTSIDFVCSLPITAVGIRVDDVVTITASADEPDLPGSTYVVIAPIKGSQQTARRLIVREVTS